MKKNILLLIALVNFTVLFAQNNVFPQPKIDYNPRSYLCMRTWDDFVVDGVLDEYAWLVAPWSENFVDIEGHLKPAPYKNTRMKMLWDDQYFYIAAELEEDHIWAKIKTHDAVIYLDNDFEVFIDPDCDNHNYFELEVNAFKTIWDLILRKPYRDASDVAMNAYEMHGVKVGVDIQGTLNDPSDKDRKWTIEIAIPWNAIKEFNSAPVPPKDGDQWKINFSRVQWETEIVNGKYVKKKDPKTNKVLPEKNWVWSPQGIIAMHYPERWGIVEFTYKVANAEIKNEVKIDPDDQARAALMKLYYQQKTFFMNHRKFSKNLGELKIPKFELEKYIWKPVIMTTDNLFEAYIISKDGKEKLTVFQDGLIKKYIMVK